jgi:uncharacterized protein YqfA (UPF0365 family)
MYYILGYLCGFIFSIAPILLWVIVPIKIKASNYGLNIKNAFIVGMLLRQSPRNLIVDTLIDLKKNGHDFSIDQVEGAYLINPHTSKTAGDLKKHTLENIATQ